VNAAEVTRINAPQWLKPIIESQGGPVLYAGEMSGESAVYGRVALIPFELRRSDLPLQVAFPILWQTASNGCHPPGLEYPVKCEAGGSRALTRDTIVLLPDGSRIAVDQRGFAQNKCAGYLWRAIQRHVRCITVNFSNPLESRIAPNPDLHVGGAPPSSEVKPQFSQREIWEWLAVIALIVLLIECGFTSAVSRC